MTERRQLSRLTYSGFAKLERSFEENIKHYIKPGTDFAGLLAEQGVTEYAEPVDAYIRISSDVNLFDDILPGRPHEADGHALEFYNSLEGMTPRLAADPNLLAYLNHFYLQKYGIARWPISENTSTTSIRRHWLTKKTENIWKSSIAGRLWWLGYVSTTTAESSGGEFVAEQVLKKFVEVPDYYIRSMEFNMFRNNLVMAEFVRALHHEADGISREGYIGMLNEVNREASARLIDSLNRQHLRKLVQQAATNQMRR